MSTTNILDLNNRIDALEKKQDQDTTDYEQLSNLPKINNVELKGNKSSNDLGIANQSDIAATFDATTAYDVGDLVYYDGTLYEFTTVHAAGAWNSEEVQAVDVANRSIYAKNIEYKNNQSVEDALDDYYNNKSGAVLATATADGVKTYSELLVELYPYRVTGCYIDIDSNKLYGNNETNYGCVAAGGSNKIRLYAIYLTSTTAYYLRDEISNVGAVTFTDLSSTVPASGNMVKLIRI